MQQRFQREEEGRIDYTLRIFGRTDIPDWILNPGLILCWNQIRIAQNCYIKNGCVGGVICFPFPNENLNILQEKAGQQSKACAYLSFLFWFTTHPSFHLTNCFCIYFPLPLLPECLVTVTAVAVSIWGTDACCYVLVWVSIPLVTSFVESVPADWFDYCHVSDVFQTLQFL